MAQWRGLRLLLVGLRTMALSLVAAELFLRFFRPVEFRAPIAELPPAERDQLLFRRSASAGLLYDMKPNMQKIVDGAMIRTNSYGMRDHEPLPNETPALFRIVALGDSFTFGLGVPVEDAYPKVLEKLLNGTAPDGVRYEVLNLAVPGYSTRDEALALRYNGLQWRPKLVILGYCLNDPETRPLQPLDLYFHTPSWWEHFHVLRLFSLFEITLETKIYGGGDYYRYLHAPQRSDWQSVLAAFKDLHAMTVARGIPTVVVIFPINEVASWSEYRYQSLHEQVAAAARASSFGVVDLYTVYSQHDPRALKVAPGDHHPSKLGHRLAAQTIAAALQREGVLAGAAPPP